MTFVKTKLSAYYGLFSLFVLFVSLSCAKGITSTTPDLFQAHFTATTLSSIGSATGNTMAIDVNGTNCGANNEAYPNLPCVKVTICSVSAPTTCQEIDNILLDTGSYGLRVFKSVISTSVLSGLTPVISDTHALGECVLYGDGSTQWGPVEYAYVQLGGEPKVGIPIQVIDASFNTVPSGCSYNNGTPDSDPTETGFNGILGVGFMAQDCGTDCVTDATAGNYYTCSNGNCEAGATVELAAQVINPIAALPTDNNGVILDLPTVGSSGSVSVSGTLTLGIGTTTSLPTSPVVLKTQTTGGVFVTNSGSSYSSNQNNWLAGFIDSGSNYYYFSTTALTGCTGTLAGFYCPTTETTLSYTNTSYPDLATHSAVTLKVISPNDATLSNTSWVFSNIGVDATGLLDGNFDWGLPFFFGRKVYVGIKGTTSSLGTGPYFAY